MSDKIRVNNNAHHEEHHEHVPGLGFLSCFHFVSHDDFSALPGRNFPDLRVVQVFHVRVHKDVLEFLFRKELRHRFCKERLTRTRSPDHHDMPPLAGCFFHDFNRMLLPEHLVNQEFRDVDIRSFLKVEIEIDIIVLKVGLL